MFDVHDYINPVTITSERDIVNVFQSNEMIRHAIPDGWERLLPRLRMEVQGDTSGSKQSEKSQFFLEGWWRRRSDGVLGYYAKINLHTGMVKEFRELSGDTAVIGELDSDTQMNYLRQCAAVLNDCLPSKETVVALDLLWQAAVPERLREFAMEERTEQSISTYLLPLESLTCWNWDKMKKLLLKRYDTTVEDILDYIEYKESGSNEFYVEPKLRDLAREKGMRFWRDGHDG